MKPAADLVIDATARHLRQREIDELMRWIVALQLRMRQQKLVHHRLRKLRLQPHTAVLPIQLRC